MLPNLKVRTGMEVQNDIKKLFVFYKNVISLP